MKNLNIAIVGATGLVGKKIIEVIEQRNLKANFVLFGNSECRKIVKIFNKKHVVQKLDVEKLKEYNLNYAFFAVDAEISKKLVPIFAKNKIVVIDNSTAFRRKSFVPLVVPQVNASALNKKNYIISNPNCSTIQLVTLLKPLDEKFKIKRVIVSTYQAVSGAGKIAIEDLQNNTTKKFDYPICNNVIPQIDIFLKNGYTREEDKLIFETRKILSLPDLNITATAVRVPVLNGHSESVNIEFEKPATKNEIVKVLKTAKNIVLQDDFKNKIYPMPLFCTGKDEVFVGRIRKDTSNSNCFNFWVVADNLRRGAASNAVDIFECLENVKIL